MSQAIIIADRYIEELCMQLGIRYDRTTRIIIDAQAGNPVRVYVSQIGDDGLLKLSPPEVVGPEILT